MDALVDPKARAILTAERAVLERLAALLERTETAATTVQQVHDLIDNLEALFLVVIVGEFNAGKSSVINALFGEKIMEEGPIPTTAKITVLRHGDERMDRQLSEFLVERRYPSPLLQNMHLVDTPGTNSIIKQHQQLTEQFVPRADLVLFVTSFDRPLTESERQFLTFLRSAWGKRLVFILNKADLSRSEDMMTQVLAHIRSGCREMMQFEPRVFPVSAEQAYAAKTSKPRDEALWQRSRFDALEAFITNTIAGPERVALKLAAPLDAASKLLDTLKPQVEGRLRVLEQDEANLADLANHLADARAELQKGYQRYLVEIDNMLLEIERRGVQFLEDTIHITKIKVLRDRDHFKEEFARQVIRDTDRQLESHITEAVDWLLKHALTAWNRTINTFADRVRSVSGDRPSQARSEFFYNRTEVFNSIMREAERKINRYDMTEEARRILENARDAASLFLGTEAVAAGIGAVATVLVTATAVDVTGGFIAAGVLALVGLIFLPREKRKAINAFKKQVEQLRAEMKKTLAAQFAQETDNSLAQVTETIDPYTRFVAEERTTLDAVMAEQDALREALAKVRQQIQRDVGTATIGD